MNISQVLLLFLIAAYLFPSHLQAQDASIKEQFRIDLHVGLRNIECDSLPNGADIDFMNYLHNGTEYSDYQYIEFNCTLQPSDKWMFSVGLKMLSDLQPSHLRMSARYFGDSLNASIRWGIGSSFHAYPQYLEAFNNYHILTDTGFSADLNPNFRQISLYDLNLDFIPFLSFSHKRFHGLIGTGIGVSAFVPFREIITQKKTYSNLRREIRYETRFSPSIFSRSEIEAGFDVIKSRKISFGVSVSADLMLSGRNISYTRTTLTWTEDERITERIDPTNRLYTRLQMSGGVYLKF